MRELFGLLREEGSSHARALFIFSILVNLMVLAPSFHMLQVYDRVLQSHSVSTLISITLIVLFALAIYGIAESIRGRIAQRLSASYAVSIAQRMFACIGKMGDSGQAARYLREYSQARNFLASRAFVNLFDLPFVPFFLLLLLFVHPTICLVTFLGLMTMCFIGFLNMRLTERTRTESRNADSDAIGFAQSAFSLGPEVRSLGILSDLITIWGHKSARALVSGDEASGVSNGLYALSRAIRQGIQVLTMAWGAWLVLAGDMSGGMIFLASMISGKALGPVEQTIGGWENTQKSLMALMSVSTLVGSQKQLQRRPDLPEPKGRLQARGLVFAGDGRRPVLTGASIDIPPGECLVINGASGSGKSVLIKLLAGGIDPDSGTVHLDGAPRSLWPITQWGRTVGYCGEEPGIFVGTVAHNISRLSTAANKNEIYRVAAALGIHDVITELPQGYQTVISPTSTLLSISQKKLISLARALYGQPRILLLDHPSAFLDQRREGGLLNALADVKKAGATIIMATHSPLLLRLADRAVTVRGGKVANCDLPSKSGQQQKPQKTGAPAIRQVQAGSDRPRARERSA